MLADDYDAFLLDLDGTLYRGDQPIEGAPEAVHRLHQAGKAVAFLTNNSGRTRAAVAEKLRGIGIEAQLEEVVSSAVATAEAVAARGATRVYCVCGPGLREELTARGVEIAPDASKPVDAVVVGWDDAATYATLRDAGLLVQRGAPLIASNADASYPAVDGRWPGAGALLAAVVATTGAQPEVIGKPNPPLFESALAVTDGSHPLVIGDRLDTDIAGAVSLGWDTLLVLSGISSIDDITAESTPTYVGATIAVLFDDPAPAQLRST